MILPLWHRTFEIVRIDPNHVLQRKNLVARHPCHRMTFASSHGTTGEDQPRTLMRLASDTHTLNEAVLPELSILRVVGVPFIVDGLPQVLKLTIELPVYFGVVFPGEASPPFVFDLVLRVRVRVRVRPFIFDLVLRVSVGITGVFRRVVVFCHLEATSGPILVVTHNGG